MSVDRVRAMPAATISYPDLTNISAQLEPLATGDQSPHIPRGAAELDLQRSHVLHPRTSWIRFSLGLALSWLVAPWVCIRSTCGI
jgi:hypothetical protein